MRIFQFTFIKLDEYRSAGEKLKRYTVDVFKRKSFDTSFTVTYNGIQIRIKNKINEMIN